MPSWSLRTLAGNLKNRARRHHPRRTTRYITIGGNGASRPDPVQAAWLYAQIARWGQAPVSEELHGIAQGVFRPDLYDAALGVPPPSRRSEPRDGIGAFVGPDFDAGDIAGHLAAWRIKRPAGRGCRSCGDFLRCTIFAQAAPLNAARAGLSRIPG